MPDIKTIVLDESLCHIAPSGELSLSRQLVGKYNIIVPEQINDITICKIDDYAFKNSAAIFSINLPNTITKIGKSAFENCPNLHSIKMPDKLEMLSAYAFNKCTGIESIIIPESIKYIRNYTFHECINLKTIILSSNIMHIDKYAFLDCFNMNILYTGTKEQLKLLIDEAKITEFKLSNINICSIYKIKDYIKDNNTNDIKRFIKDPVLQEYVLNEIDNLINYSTDINEKLQLLTIRNDINKENILNKNDDFER